MSILQHKVVSSLPLPLEPDSIYYVRRGSGFDQYVTNKSGVIVAYPENITILEQNTGQYEDSAMSQKAVTDALETKVDKVTGKGLSDENFTQAEKTKLSGIATGATKNRADIENADKLHTHTISDVTGLSARLDDIDALIGDVSISKVADNRLEQKPDGLYVKDRLDPDPVAYYLLSRG